MDQIAGAVANAIRQSLTNRSASSVSPNSSSSSSLVANVGNSTRPARPPTTFEQAVELRKRPKFEPPSLFQNVRNRRSRKRDNSRSKPVSTYVRDIILLPKEFKCRDGDISIPRCSRRNKLGKTGLVGKIQINYDMTDTEIHREICEIFVAPMELNEDNIKSGQLFPFTYLQRAGAGCRSLCVPSVKDSFEWNGKEVVSLAKSGSYIYLLANAELPGYQKLVSHA